MSRVRWQLPGMRHILRNEMDTDGTLLPSGQCDDSILPLFGGGEKIREHVI